MKYGQIILTSYCHENIDMFSAKTRAIVTFWFWSVVFIADFLSLTWYVILLPLQINMKLFKKEMEFANKQCITEEEQLYFAVG